MRKFFKKYWFVILVSLFIAVYLTVFLLVLFSPKTDKLNRGFIPCTKKMAEEILRDETKSSWNLVKIIIKNTYCDTTVVFNGLSDWVKGKQSTPWANYFFEPEEDGYIDADNEELINFYKENPYISKDMEELDKQRQELEQNLLEMSVTKEVELIEVVEEKFKDEEEKENTDDETEE